jgi:DNA-binding beta-propeller fold protein YncE
MVLDKNGNDVLNIPANGTTLDGPWGLAVSDRGSQVSLFVANVLNGTVSRINLAVHARTDSVSVTSETMIGSGYKFSFNSAALVLGPAGLAFDPAHSTLYVASTQDNEIFAIRNAMRLKSSAGTGSVVYQDSTHLHGPIGLALAGNGNLIAANADAVNADPMQNSELAEFTPKGQFVAQLSIDAAASAAPFGLAVETVGRTTVLAAVNDDTNQLEIFAVTKKR